MSLILFGKGSWKYLLFRMYYENETLAAYLGISCQLLLNISEKEKVINP
jgi:hypothetical protein